MELGSCATCAQEPDLPRARTTDVRLCPRSRGRGARGRRPQGYSFTVNFTYGTIYLLRVEESFPALHVALPAAAAVGLRLRSGVVPAVWSRWHVSRTTSDAQGSITRAARAMPWQHAFSAGRRSHDSAELWTIEADLTMAHDIWVRVITLTLTRSHCIARPSHAVATLITAPSSLLPTDRIESGTFCGTG